MAQSILRLPAVKARTGLSRSSIYLRMSQGQFPQSIPLGPRIIGWLETDIETWIVRQSKKKPQPKFTPLPKPTPLPEAIPSPKRGRRARQEACRA
jgi:prophage regulatory protein